MKQFDNACPGRAIVNIVLTCTVLTVACNTAGPTGAQASRCPEYVEWLSAGEMDPGLRVIRPNGGERFLAGRPCTLNVSSREPSDVIVQFEVDGVRFTPDELRGSKRVHRDTSLIFVVPTHFTYSFYDMTSGMPQDTLLSTESASCRVRITQYESPEFFDVSDCFFSIE